MRGMITRAAGFMIALVFTAISARADEPSVDPAPSVGPLVSLPTSAAPSTLELHLLPTPHVGEPTTSSDAPSAADVLAPLRLALLSGIFPIGRTLDPDCANHADESGNMIHGMNLQRALFLRMTSKLTLNAFSSTGCVGDSGGGGGITFVQPLLHNLWLVLGAGAYAVPAVGTIPARVTSEIRADVVIKRKSGNTFTLGLGAGTRSQGHTPSSLGGFRFGGSF